MKIIIITIAVLALLLTGCFESEDAGTARANSAATQNQMDEMSAIVSQLIDQNAALQETAIQASQANSGVNVAAWFLLAVATVLAVLALLLAPFYMRLLQSTQQPPQQPTMLAAPPTMLPAPTTWIALDENNQPLLMANTETGEVIEAKRSR